MAQCLSQLRLAVKVSISAACPDCRAMQDSWQRILIYAHKRCPFRAISCTGTKNHTFSSTLAAEQAYFAIVLILGVIPHACCMQVLTADLPDHHPSPINQAWLLACTRSVAHYSALLQRSVSIADTCTHALQARNRQHECTYSLVKH